MHNLRKPVKRPQVRPEVTEAEANVAKCEIILLGKQYQVACPEGEQEILKNSAGYLNEIIQENIMLVSTLFIEHRMAQHRRFAAQRLRNTGLLLKPLAVERIDINAVLSTQQ